MRFLHALIVATVLFLGQISLCPGVYVRADGTVCPTCAPSASLQRAEESRSELVGTTADCRDCCTLAACSNHNDRAVTHVVSGMEFVLPKSFIDLPTSWEAPDIQAISAHIESFFPNAPPGVQSDRAPPFCVM